MRRTSKSIIAGILLSLATAAFSGAAKAAACVSDTLDKYTAPGFTCSIGDMTFANFTWTSSGSTGGGSAPPATSEMAVPDGLGFDLDGLFTASSGAIADAILHYTVTTTDATNTIDHVRLYAVGGQSGTGTSGVDEVLCVGGLLGACPAGGNYALSVTGNGVAAQVAFAGANEVDIRKDIYAAGGAVGIGDAVVRDQYSRSAGARAVIAGSPRGRFVRPWRSARVSKVTGRPSQARRVRRGLFAGKDVSLFGRRSGPGRVLT